MTISRADRDRMADDLNALGFYATSNAVRKGNAKLTEGVAHVRDYCLPGIERAIARLRSRNADSPPIPGTWGWHAVPNAEARRDELVAFLVDWAPYDFPALTERAA